jgi:hypothetical protein
MSAFGVLLTMKCIAITWAKKSGWEKGPDGREFTVRDLHEKRCAANPRGSREV